MHPQEGLSQYEDRLVVRQPERKCHLKIFFICSARRAASACGKLLDEKTLAWSARGGRRAGVICDLDAHPGGEIGHVGRKRDQNGQPIIRQPGITAAVWATNNSNSTGQIVRIRHWLVV
jgi:hypothetical protein